MRPLLRPSLSASIRLHRRLRRNSSRRRLLRPKDTALRVAEGTRERPHSVRGAVSPCLPPPEGLRPRRWGLALGIHPVEGSPARDGPRRGKEARTVVGFGQASKANAPPNGDPLEWTRGTVLGQTQSRDLGRKSDGRHETVSGAVCRTNGGRPWDWVRLGASPLWRRCRMGSAGFEPAIFAV
jgi:hypothetical protein